MKEIQEFREGLPIFEYKAKIIQSAKDHDFSIVTGDTGSGKSTQLPQYMMDSDVIRESIINSQKNV